MTRLFKLLLAALAAVIFVILAWRLMSARRTQTTTGELLVLSAPEGAQVSLDGVEQGVTPWRKSDLAPGFYLLKVELKGMAWEGKVRVAEDGLTQVSRRLLPGEYASGSVVSQRTAETRESRLAVTSNLTGVKVWLDERERGETPLILPLADSNTGALSLRLDGYQILELDLEWSEGESLIVEADLGRDVLSRLNSLGEDIPTSSVSLASSSIIGSELWRVLSTICAESTCRTEKWRTPKFFTGKLTGGENGLRDFLQAVQVESRDKWLLPDFPFAYIIAPDGAVYAGSETKDLDYSFWDWAVTSKDFFQFVPGDYPVLLLVNAWDESVSAAAKEAAAQLRQLLNPTTIAVKTVTIKDTPTGFLNLRSGPSLNASVMGRVYPGASYELLEEKEGWYKIKVSETVSSWIYAQYAVKN